MICGQVMFNISGAQSNNVNVPVHAFTGAPIIIEAVDLYKRFGDFTAVDGISLNVRKGEIFGLLGPNGAGKTTTVRMLTTLLAPTSGTIKLDGYDISESPNEAKKLIGISQQHISLDKDISVGENLRYKAMLLNIPRAEAKLRIENLSKVMGLDPYMDKIVADLSGGWKRRTAIVCAILHNPSILFLDEPTAGLDTQSRHILWELIRSLRDNGTTIILTTHYIEEAESLCDNIAIVDKGRIVLNGTPEELCRSFGRWTVEYIDDRERRNYRFFDKKDEADAFIRSCGSPEKTLLRRTHLEDIYLEKTGREAEVEGQRIVW